MNRSPPSKRTGSKPACLDDRVAADQIVTEVCDRRLEPGHGDLQRRVDPQQHEARNATAPPEHQIAEILVFGQKQPIIRPGTRQHGRVAFRRREFGHIDDVVARSA